MSEALEQHVAAFLVWAGDGEQSTAKTAELTGIPQRTIQYYLKRDDWRGQWLSSGAGEAERAAQQGKQMLRHATPMVAKRLLHMIGGMTEMRNQMTGAIVTNADGSPVMVYASQDRDAVQAMKLALLYSLGTPLSATDVGDGAIFTAQYTVPNESLLPPPEPGEETTAQLRARASQMLEATVQSVNTRMSSTTQRRKRV